MSIIGTLEIVRKIILQFAGIGSLMRDNDCVQRWGVPDIPWERGS